MTAAPTVYVDVTETLASGLHTGIQRVVRKIAAGLVTRPGGRFVPVLAKGGRFHRLNAAGIERLCAPAGPSAAARFTDDGRMMQLVKRTLAVAPPVYDWVQVRYFRGKIVRRLAGLYDRVPLAPAGASIVLLDSFWGGSTALAAARRARRAGCTVAAVVYDMIPVTHPQFHDERLARVFPRAMADAAQICTGVLTISRYCRSVIERFLAERGVALPVSHFYLGADFAVDRGGRTANRLPDVGGGGRLHLMVGTIEPRKGHAVVLDAFDRLWAEGHDDRLLIVGKIGWHVEPLVARLQDHPERGRRLFTIHNADDATLACAFATADAAIMASTVEGFGLPLVEALYHRLPVITADIPVFREIGGDGVVYFALDDPVDLARKVVAMGERGDEYLAATADFVWLDWTAAVTQFEAALASVTCPLPQPLASPT